MFYVVDEWMSREMTFGMAVKALDVSSRLCIFYASTQTEVTISIVRHNVISQGVHATKKTGKPTSK